MRNKMHPFKRIIYSSMAIFIVWITIELFCYLVYQCNILPSVAQSKRDIFYWKNKEPHPYLGYISRSNDLEPNQFLKNDVLGSSDFNVGIFGGSVANSLCNSKRSDFKRDLSKLIVDKNIFIDCLAEGGYAQPQQMIFYMLYGKKYHLAIFLEGANELMVCSKPMGKIEYPMHRISAVYYTDIEESLYNRTAVILLIKLMKWSSSGQLPSKKVLAHFFQFFASKFSERMGGLHDRQSSNFSCASAEYLYDLWNNSLKTLDRLSMNSPSSKTFVFMQPFLDAKKTKSRDEEIWNQSINYSDDFLKSWRSAEERMKKVEFKNIYFQSMAHLFSEEKGTVFIDSVHLNKTGNERLFNEIINEISKYY